MRVYFIFIFPVDVLERKPSIKETRGGEGKGGGSMRHWLEKYKEPVVGKWRTELIKQKDDEEEKKKKARQGKTQFEPNQGHWAKNHIRVADIFLYII